MPRRILGLALLGAGLLATPAGAAPAWRIDPGTSRIAVTVTQAGKPVEARFEQFDGTVAFDSADLATSAVMLQIDPATFRTGESTRDGQATGPAWLNAKGHSFATYRTLSMRSAGGEVYDVDAELTLRGISKRFTHQVTIAVQGDRATATGTVPLARTDFGVGTAADPKGQTVGLEVTVAFTLKAERAGP